MLKKIFIAVAVALSVLLSLFITRASAETVANWARVVEEDVYLYSTEEDSQRSFVLEKSYYVQILSETDKMYFVSVMQNEADFPQITGYVYKSRVLLCSVPPLSPYYPAVKVTVNNGSAAVRLSPLRSSPALVTALTAQKLSYYGKIVSEGETWYFVQYGGKLGYVQAEDVTAPNVPLHPSPLPSAPAVSTPSDISPEPELPAETNSPAAEILLIVFVVALAVGLTLALFLPGNVKKKSVFEQDI